MGEPSELELQFDALWEMLFPEIDLDTELRLIPGRKFRFDYVHLSSRVAIEVNGGIYAKGESGHSSGTGIKRDYEKCNFAIANHYVCFMLSADMICEDWLILIAQTILSRERSFRISEKNRHEK